MAVVAVGHAADDGILVSLFGQQRHQFADADAVHVGGNGLVKRAAVIVAGLRFGIEGVEMGRAAPHPNLDDRLGLGLGDRDIRQRPQCQVVTQHQAARSEEGAAHGFAAGNGAFAHS